tara:strand:- start:2973 stop:3809 length:837 start_codon:yes stop_codon:yes gene_type:complete
MNCEPDSENSAELVHDMTQLAYSWLNSIEQIFKSFRRVSKRFPIEHDNSHNGRILNSEIIRCYAQCLQNVKKLDDTYQPQHIDPSRLNLASELIKEANAEWLEPISFKGYTAFTALEAVHHITESLYSSDFQAIPCWAEEREDAAFELEEIGKFLDDFPELNTDFFSMLQFKLEQQQIIAEKSFRAAQLEKERLNLELILKSANSANYPEIKLPENPDVIELCKLLKKKPANISYNEVAREFVGDTGANWKSLISQARNFKHLWHPDHIQYISQESRE